MSKRNQKKNQRKKANIKKRNMQRVARKGSSTLRSEDHGLSLANAGANDLMEILTWSRVLANEPEFGASIFDPLLCTQAFNEHSIALGLDKNVDDLPKELYLEKQTELTLATVESVLTKDHKRQIVQRLKKLRTRFKQANDQLVSSRVDILLSLIDFSKDEKVWGTVGLVSALVMQNVRDLMLFTSLAQSIEVEGKTFDDLMASIQDHPDHARMVAMIEHNPNLMNYFERRFDQIWISGVSALEKGDLSLNLFEAEAHQFAEDALEDIRSEEGEYDSGKGPLFLSRLRTYFSEKLADDLFLKEIKEKLSEIVAAESVESDHLAFVFRLLNALDEAEWVEQSGADMMVQILLADLQQPDDIEEDNEVSSEDAAV